MIKIECIYVYFFFHPFQTGKEQKKKMIAWIIVCQYEKKDEMRLFHAMTNSIVNVVNMVWMSLRSQNIHRKLLERKKKLQIDKWHIVIVKFSMSEDFTINVSIKNYILNMERLIIGAILHESMGWMNICEGNLFFILILQSTARKIN